MIGTAALSPMASPADQAAEIARLRRELERTRQERFSAPAPNRVWLADITYPELCAGLP